MQKNSHCQCSTLPTVVSLHHGNAGCFQAFVTLAWGNWVKLMQCPNCKQLWKVDEWDKYLNCYGIKLQTISDWQSLSMKASIKNFLIDSQGLSTGGCVRFACQNPSLQPSAYCAECYLSDRQDE